MWPGKKPSCCKYTPDRKNVDFFYPKPCGRLTVKRGLFLGLATFSKVKDFFWLEYNSVGKCGAIQEIMPASASLVPCWMLCSTARSLPIRDGRTCYEQLRVKNLPRRKNGCEGGEKTPAGIEVLDNSFAFGRCLFAAFNAF